MEGIGAVAAAKKSSAAADSERIAKLKQRLEKLLRDAAEVEVELSRADGTIRGVPHYSVIEGRAHQLGKQLSREVQRRQMNELAACQPRTAKCPSCGRWCELKPHHRPIKSVDGAIAMQELVAYCPCCRKIFFPSA